MHVIYRKKDGIILSTVLSNISFEGLEEDMLEKMFPGVDVGFCTLNIDESIPLTGFKLCLDKGVPKKIMSRDLTVYEVPQEEFDLLLKNKSKREEADIQRLFPFRAKKHTGKSFLNMFKTMRHTSDETLLKINNGTYMSQGIQGAAWWGSFTDAGGYANMNRELTMRLHNHGIIPVVDIYPTIKQIDARTERILNRYASLKPKSNDHPYVYAFTPMPHAPHPGKRIFFTMMETSTLHKEFVSNCNVHSDEVWVPSEANKELFAENGVKKTIKVVPLGIDELLYFREHEQKRFDGYEGLFGQPVKDGIKSFKFLTVIQWNFRKGFDALIKSFINRFDSDDDVCLVIATQYARDTVLRDLKEFLPRHERLPQVLLYNKVVGIDDMPSFYRNFDCYVHLSRGEGFSLTQVEAAACGLPVISCCHSGMTEYLREDNSYPIYCDDTEPCHSRLSAICYYYEGQRLWKLGSQQIEKASEMMDAVYSDYESARGRAQVFYDDVKNKYTWQHAVSRVASLLKI
jgi:glycosyltransferase involved in cell wall biosynthesis